MALPMAVWSTEYLHHFLFYFILTLTLPNGTRLHAVHAYSFPSFLIRFSLQHRHWVFALPLYGIWCDAQHAVHACLRGIWQCFYE